MYPNFELDQFSRNTAFKNVIFKKIIMIKQPKFFSLPEKVLARYSTNELYKKQFHDF